MRRPAGGGGSPGARVTVAVSHLSGGSESSSYNQAFLTAEPSPDYIYF